MWSMRNRDWVSLLGVESDECHCVRDGGQVVRCAVVAPRGQALDGWWGRHPEMTSLGLDSFLRVHQRH